MHLFYNRVGRVYNAALLPMADLVILAIARSQSSESSFSKSVELQLS